MVAKDFQLSISHLEKYFQSCMAKSLKRLSHFFRVGWFRILFVLKFTLTLLFPIILENDLLNTI